MPTAAAALASGPSVYLQLLAVQPNRPFGLGLVQRLEELALAAHKRGEGEMRDTFKAHECMT